MRNTTERKTKIVTVFSTKGGVGKTVIASNLAALLSQSGMKTALIDLNMNSGDIALSMNLVTGVSINDLAAGDIDKLDIDMLESYMIKHETGTMVLPAPVSPEYDDILTPIHISKIFDILKGKYEWIVIDCPSNLHDRVLMVLDSSDVILLVTAMDLFSIKNIKNCMGALEEAGYSKERLRLVINRAFYGSEIGKKDISAAVGLPVTAVMAQEDKVVIGSINQGVPAVLSYKRSKFSKGIRKLAEKLLYESTEMLA